MKTKRLKNNKKPYTKDSLASLILLVGLASCGVFYQYCNWHALARGGSPLVRQIQQKKLLQIAPKKELMANNALRCETESAGRKSMLTGKYSLDQFTIKNNIAKLVGDKPMQNMVAEIATRNVQTASYLVAIAKHESNLGKFSPKKDGKDCFNYWGFRGSYNKTKSGYSCFDSPAQAVAVVGNRIQGLNEIEDVDTPEGMLIWKCGGSCAGHDPADVARWKRDVDFYYKKINS